MGWVSVIVVLILVGVPGFYFGIMVLPLGIVGGIVTIGFALLAMMCFLAIIGTILCASRIIMRASIFKWLLISLSVLGMIPLPVTAYSGETDAKSLALFAVLAGWSFLLMVATLIAFSYISAMARKEPKSAQRASTNTPKSLANHGSFLGRQPEPRYIGNDKWPVVSRTGCCRSDNRWNSLMGKYSETLTEHVLNPKNGGAIEIPDVTGHARAPGRGAFMILYLKVQDDRIAVAEYHMVGCGPMMASGSMLTEMIARKSITEYRELTVENPVEALDGMPRDKLDCSALAVEALRDTSAKWPNSGEKTQSNPIDRATHHREWRHFTDSKIRLSHGGHWNHRVSSDDIQGQAGGPRSG